MPAPDYATEIAALEKALASGELTIEANGERVTYRSTADIRAALGHFQNKATANNPNPALGGSAFGFSAVAYDRN